MSAVQSVSLLSHQQWARSQGAHRQQQRRKFGDLSGGLCGAEGEAVVEVWEEGEDARCEDMESTWSSGN